MKTTIQKNSKYYRDCQKAIYKHNQNILKSIKPSRKYLKPWRSEKTRAMGFWRWLLWCVNPGNDLN